jgi:hypothetical protein
MGAGASIPETVEDAKTQGFSDDDINKYIEENKGDDTSNVHIILLGASGNRSLCQVRTAFEQLR